MSMEWEGVIGLAREQNWGDAFVAATKKIACNTVSARTIPIVPDDVRATKTRMARLAVLTGLTEEFSWEQWVNPLNIGEVLLFLFGSVSTGAGPPYTHTYSMATTAAGLPGFTLFVDRGVSGTPTKAITGAKINQVTFENSAAEILLATPEGGGRTSSSKAAMTITSGDCTQFATDPFIFADLAYQQALNGVALANDQTIENLSIVINNNIVQDKRSADGSLYIQEQKAGMLEVSGSYDKEFESYAEYNAFIANQQLDMMFTWTSGSNVLRLILPNNRITNLPLPDIGGSSERAIVTIEFRTLYDCADDYGISCLLTNSESGDYDLCSSSSSSSSSSSNSSSSSSSSSNSSSSSSSSSSESI